MPEERHFLTASGSPFKYHQEITRLLQAVQQPIEVAVIHCKGHQKGMDALSEGNMLADAAAKWAARSQVIPTAASLVWDGCTSQEKAHFSTEEEQRASE